MGEDRARGRAGRLILAGVLALMGAVWVGQGLGWIGGSFMTGERSWVVIGAGTIVGAVVLAVRSRADG